MLYNDENRLVLSIFVFEETWGALFKKALTLVRGGANMQKHGVVTALRVVKNLSNFTSIAFFLFSK